MNVEVIDQERLVLGIMIVKPEMITELNMQVSDFGHVESQAYYESIQRLISRKEPVGIFSVIEDIKNETGACHKDILMLMANESAQHPSMAFSDYAQRIKKESLSRKAFKIINELTIDLNAGKTESIAETVSKLMGIDQADKNYSHSFDEAARLVFNDIDKTLEGNNGMLSTGFNSLNKAMGGLFPSDLIIIPARPAMGKTAVMVNMFLEGEGIPGIISGEQGVTQLATRALCIGGGVNHHSVRTGILEDKDWDNLTLGTAKFTDKKGFIFDKPAPTMLDIEKVCRRWVFKNNVNVIFIDYAQRISHENRKLNKYEQMSDIAMRLKELARALNVPVIALAQVNRACEGRPDRRPQMGDIADASAFEKEADAIITLYRDEVYNEESNEKGVIELDFKKNRHGPTGCIKMTWKPQFMRIEDFSAYEYQQSYD